MGIQEFILNKIAPIAIEKVTDTIDHEDIHMYKQPYFDRDKSTELSNSMIKIYKNVANELAGEYEYEMKKAFLESQTIKLLTSRILREEGKESEFIKGQIELVESKLSTSVKEYELASRVASFLNDN